MKTLTRFSKPVLYLVLLFSWNLSSGKSHPESGIDAASASKHSATMTSPGMHGDMKMKILELLAHPEHSKGEMAGHMTENSVILQTRLTLTNQPFNNDFIGCPGWTGTRSILPPPIRMQRSFSRILPLKSKTNITTGLEHLLLNIK